MEFSELLGKTLSKVTVVSSGTDEYDDNRITFECEDGTVYQLFHEQFCCEKVIIESIVGDIDDLIGTPILLAEETSRIDESGEFESGTWTFYKLRTIKCSVDIRWIGTSNGFYSERVTFSKVKP